MSSYILKRALLVPPLLLGISFLSFVLINLSPSDPAEVALRVNEIVPTEEAVAAMKEELGLEKPFLTRYFNWLGDFIRLDLGVSYITRKPIIEDLAPAVGPTVRLALAALSLIVFCSLSLGLVCAVWENRWPDILGRGFIFLSTSVPNYWAGLLLLWLFSLRFDLLPLGGMAEPLSIALPAVTLSLAYIGTYLRLIRASVLANLKSDYADYARLRGFKESAVIIREVLPNSIKTTVTALGMSIPKLIAGTVVVESIFAWPGLGRLCVKAIFDRDLPMIQIYILMMGALFVIFNFIADVLQTRLDPRPQPEESL